MLAADWSSWRQDNAMIFYGEVRDRPPRPVQLGMFALHILQAGVVYVNSFMIQDILAEPE